MRLKKIEGPYGASCPAVRSFSFGRRKWIAEAAENRNENRKFIKSWPFAANLLNSVQNFWFAVAVIINDDDIVSTIQ